MKVKLKTLGIALLLACCFKLFIPHFAYAQVHYRPLPLLKLPNNTHTIPIDAKASITALTADAAEVCFTPGGPCTDLLVATLAKAKQQVLVQAYQLTAQPIAQALINAKARGIDVDVILDKSQLHQRSAMTCQLLAHGIPVLIDKKPAIAHNKVMVIDENEVVTGSFNFSDNAQYHNAENLLVIHDKKLAQAYLQNWRQRASQSITLDPEQQEKLACRL
jgi:phosphatidylserine/phosphatidylglycerophosphate/cardiolipin synthase-like enzyme